MRESAAHRLLKTVLDGPRALIQKLLSTNTEFFLAWHSGVEVPELPVLSASPYTAGVVRELFLNSAFSSRCGFSLFTSYPLLDSYWVSADLAFLSVQQVRALENIGDLDGHQ